jgi:hypothetical protein
MLAGALLALNLGACTPSVPPAATELSRAVGDRIAATQASHEAFVTEYFASSRARVEDFLQQRWIPEFLANYTEDAQLMTLLTDSTLVGHTGDEERGSIVLDFATSAIEEIEAQRRTLLDPIDRLERQTLKELRGSYADLVAMNASVTSYLESTQKLSDAQDDVLRRLNLLEARDRSLRDAASLHDQIESILDRADEADALYERLREFLDGIPSRED